MLSISVDHGHAYYFWCLVSKNGGAGEQGKTNWKDCRIMATVSVKSAFRPEKAEDFVVPLLYDWNQKKLSNGIGDISYQPRVKGLYRFPP